MVKTLLVRISGLTTLVSKPLVCISPFPFVWRNFFIPSKLSNYYLPLIYFLPFNVLTQNIFSKIFIFKLRSVWTHWLEETDFNINCIRFPFLFTIWSIFKSRQEKKNKMASEVESPKKMKEKKLIKSNLKAQLNKGANTLSFSFFFLWNGGKKKFLQNRNSESKKIIKRRNKHTNFRRIYLVFREQSKMEIAFLFLQQNFMRNLCEV